MLGDIRPNQELLSEWQSFLSRVMALKSFQATGFAVLDLEGGDWGFITTAAAAEHVNLPQACRILRKLGFTLKVLPWGIIRMEAPEGVPDFGLEILKAEEQLEEMQGERCVELD